MSLSNLVALIPDGGVVEWESAFKAFTDRFKGVGEFKGEYALEQDDKVKLFGFLVNQFAQFASGGPTAWPSSLQQAALVAVRVLTRTRSDLDALYSKDGLRAVAQMSESSAPTDVSLAADAMSVLVNLCVIDHVRVLRVCEDIDLDTLVVSALEVSFGSIFNHSLAIPIKKGSTQTDSLDYASLRVLFYLTIEKKLADRLAQDLRIYKQKLIQYTDSSTFFLDPRTSEIVVEIFKVLFNLGSHHGGTPGQEIRKDVPNLVMDALEIVDKQAVLGKIVEILALPIDADPESKQKEAQEPISIANLWTVKRHAINSLIYIPNTVVEEALTVAQPVPPRIPIVPESHLPSPVGAPEPTRLFEVPSIMAGLAEFFDMILHAPNLSGATILPITAVLTGMVKASDECKLFFKYFVFGSHASAEIEQPTTESGKPTVDPIKDENPESVRSILLKNMTSLHEHVVEPVTEFLWALCDEDSSELIRLTGFGNAIGLLARKGLPGFEGLTSQAISLSQLAEMAKAAKAQGGDEDDGKGQ